MFDADLFAVFEQKGCKIVYENVKYNLRGISKYLAILKKKRKAQEILTIVNKLKK